MLPSAARPVPLPSNRAGQSCCAHLPTDNEERTVAKSPAGLKHGLSQRANVYRKTSRTRNDPTHRSVDQRAEPSDAGPPMTGSLGERHVPPESCRVPFGREHHTERRASFQGLVQARPSPTRAEPFPCSLAADASVDLTANPPFHPSERARFRHAPPLRVPRRVSAAEGGMLETFRAMPASGRPSRCLRRRPVRRPCSVRLPRMPVSTLRSSGSRPGTSGSSCTGTVALRSQQAHGSVGASRRVREVTRGDGTEVHVAVTPPPSGGRSSVPPNPPTSKALRARPWL